MYNRLISLIRKEFIQIIRDPRTLALTFIMPVMMLFLLGYAATNDVRNIGLAVMDQDQSSSSRKLLQAYLNADYFKLSGVVFSEKALRERIDNNSFAPNPHQIRKTSEYLTGQAGKRASQHHHRREHGRKILKTHH